MQIRANALYLPVIMKLTQLLVIALHLKQMRICAHKVHMIGVDEPDGS